MSEKWSSSSGVATQATSATVAVLQEYLKDCTDYTEKKKKKKVIWVFCVGFFYDLFREALSGKQKC